MGVTDLTVETIAGIIGIAGTLFAACFAALKLGRRVLRVLPAVDRLHDIFGDSPVDELHRIVSEAGASIGEIGIRQRIAERHLALGVFVASTEGEWEFANDFLCEQLELDSREVRGFGWLAAIDKEQRDRVYDDWKSSIERRLPYVDKYRICPGHDGENWEAITEAWPVMRDGAVVCFVGYVKRINE